MAACDGTDLDRQMGDGLEDGVGVTDGDWGRLRELGRTVAAWDGSWCWEFGEDGTIEIE